MRLDQVPAFALQSRSGNHLVLNSTSGATAHVWVLEEDIVRVLLLPQGRLQMPRSWTVAPGLEDLPVEGRDRFDVSGFSLPAFELKEEGAQLQITTAAVRLTIALDGFFAAGKAGTRAVGRPAPPTGPRKATTSAGGTRRSITTCSVTAARPTSAWASAPAMPTAPASATACATSTPWATARAAPTRCTSTSRSTSPARG